METTYRRAAAKILTLFVLSNVCFYYKSPRSGKNFDTFMQENAQTCIKMNACFHFIRDIFMQENALKYGCFIFMQENALKYGCLFSLPFAAQWRVAAKLSTFLCRKCTKIHQNKCLFSLPIAA